MSNGTRGDLEKLITERLGRPGWQGSYELLMITRDSDGFSLSEVSILGIIPPGTDILNFLSVLPREMSFRPPFLVQAGFWGMVLTGTTAYINPDGTIAPVRMAFATSRMDAEESLAVMTDADGLPMEGPMGMLGGEHLPLLLGRILACILARCC